MKSWLLPLKSIYYGIPLPVGWRNKLDKVILRVLRRLDLGNGVVVGPQAPDRKRQLLMHISPSTQIGLEIGPLCWPIVTKAESNNNVFYVDFSTAEKSREKYKNDPNVIIENIVETDYLWGKQTMPELVDGKQFDYVVASHVIEHVPNMLGWLREVAGVLKDHGILSLAIPDKRFTFDYKKDVTSFGFLIESYLMDRRRPSVRDLFDHVYLSADVNAVEAWRGNIDPAKPQPWSKLDDAFKHAQRYHASDEYEDVHVNILTPASFVDALEKSARLDILDFELLDLCPTPQNSLEFYVALRRIPRGLAREDLRKRQLDGIAQARAKI